jgi:hypothetical protein
MFVINAAYAQLPRGEAAGSMFDDDPVGLLFILGIIHIYLGFKESTSQGTINLSQVAAIIAVILFFPKLGSLIIALLLGMLLYTLIKGYF